MPGSEPGDIHRLRPAGAARRTVVVHVVISHRDRDALCGERAAAVDGRYVHESYPVRTPLLIEVRDHGNEGRAVYCHECFRIAGLL